MKPTLMVLAAGIGSRYGGLKQMDPVGPSGEIVLDYSLYDALRSGFEKVVFVIRRDIEKDFRELVGKRIESHIEVAYAFQEIDMIPEGFSDSGRTKPWGTGHAVLVAESAVPGPFAVINADDFYGRESFGVLGEYLQAESTPSDSMQYAMVGFQLSKTLSAHGHVARGVCDISDDGFLQSVCEHTRIEKRDNRIVSVDADGQETALTGREIVSMNCWGVMPSLFAELSGQFREFLEARSGEPKAEFFIPSVIDRMIKENKATVKILPSHATWFGVTYREDKDEVVRRIRELVQQGDYPERLWLS